MTTWAIWFVAAMIVFACIEGFAPTARRAGARLPFAIGLVIGALAVHSGDALVPILN